MVTIIGLGNEYGDLSKRGENAILQAANTGAKIFVRTALTRSYQTVVELGVEHECLDYVYQNSRNFATLAKNLAKAVLNGGENAGLLALQILGIKYPEIAVQLAQYKTAMKDKINADDEALQQLL